MRRIVPLVTSMLVAAALAPAATQAASGVYHGCGASEVCVYQSSWAVSHRAPSRSWACRPSTISDPYWDIYEIVNNCGGRVWFHWTGSPAQCFSPEGHAPAGFANPDNLQITRNPRPCPR